MEYKKRYLGIKAFGIARVSDPKQVSALPAQKRRLYDYAKDRGLDLEYYEFNESAYSGDREKFLSIVDKIMAYDKYCVIVFDKIDRLTRNGTDATVDKLKQCVKDGILELHFPSDGLFLSKASPANDYFRLGMGTVAAEYYSLSNRDNVNRIIEDRIAEGQYMGRAPIGYKNVPIDEHHSDIIIDKEREPMIKKAFEMRLEGFSLKEIADEMNRIGLRSNTYKMTKITKAQLSYMFQNKFYCGQMYYRKQHYPHRYPVYISTEEYDAIQEITKGKRRNYAHDVHKNEYLFNGIIKCACCGCSMSSYEKKGHIYLKCSGGHGICRNHASEADLVTQVESILDGFKIDESIAEHISAEIRQRDVHEFEVREATRKSLKNECQILARRKKVLYMDRLDGRITIDEYDKIASDIDEEMKEKEAQIMMTEEKDISDATTASYLLELAKRAGALFRNSRPEQKRQILSLVLSNLQVDQKRLQFNLLEPFKSLSNCANSQKWLPRSDSN